MKEATKNDMLNNKKAGMFPELTVNKANDDHNNMVSKPSMLPFVMCHFVVYSK